MTRAIFVLPVKYDSITTSKSSQRFRNSSKTDTYNLRSNNAACLNYILKYHDCGSLSVTLQLVAFSFVVVVESFFSAENNLITDIT